MERFTVRVEGSHLSGETRGRGPPLLVMPVSWGMDYAIYTKGLSALEPHATLVFFDPRGVGDSGPAREEDASLDVTASDADRLREHLGHERWSVLGHSNGGFAALKHALAHPDRVECLILVCTAASNAFQAESLELLRRHPRWAEFLERDEAFRREGTEASFRALMETVFEMAVLDPDRFRAANAQLLAKMRFSPRRLKYETSIDLPRYDLTGRLPEIRAPALAIAGRHDRLVPPSASAVLARGIPETKFVLFDESGHWPFVEERARFTLEVARFLGAAVGKEGRSSG